MTDCKNSLETARSRPDVDNSVESLISGLMAVQKSKKSSSRAGMRRSHQHVKKPTLSIDADTGEIHRRHQMTPDGFFKGRLVKDITGRFAANDDEEEGAT